MELALDRSELNQGDGAGAASLKVTFSEAPPSYPWEVRLVSTDDERIELPRQLRWALPFYTVLFVVTVWSMVAKLGA